MVEGRDRARFLKQPPGEDIARRSCGSYELHGHVAAQRGITREVDLAHPARTDQAAQPITSEFLPLGVRVHLCGVNGGIIVSGPTASLFSSVRCSTGVPER